jgi:hypothetical protein
MADTKGGGMESSVPMIMGGRKASAFHVRTQDSRTRGEERERKKTLRKKPDGDFAPRCPHFFSIA